MKKISVIGLGTASDGVDKVTGQASTVQTLAGNGWFSLRSPHAHARQSQLTSKAEKVPGVKAFDQRMRSGGRELDTLELYGKGPRAL